LLFPFTEIDDSVEFRITPALLVNTVVYGMRINSPTLHPINDKPQYHRILHISIFKAGRIHEDDLAPPVGRMGANDVFHFLRTRLQIMANGHYILSRSSVDKLA
jgi:hypothetical protein